jgi:hypothetical protein
MMDRSHFMWLTRKDFEALLERPYSAEGTAARRYVADSVFALRETQFVQRSLKRSLLFSRCALDFKAAPLHEPYNPDGPGCFVTKSRDWRKLRRVWWSADGSDAAIVHRGVLPLLKAVHDLQQPSSRWGRFQQQLLLVRRATKLFLREHQPQDVVAGVEPAPVAAASMEQPAKGVPGRLPRQRSGAQATAAQPEVDAFAGGPEDAPQVVGQPGLPLEAQVGAPEVGGVAVRADHRPARQVGDRKRKHRAVEGQPEGAVGRAAGDPAPHQRAAKRRRVKGAGVDVRHGAEAAEEGGAVC